MLRHDSIGTRLPAGEEQVKINRMQNKTVVLIVIVVR
jgi:hypothetical protein